MCGPVLDGVLAHADLLGSSWRSMFVVNVPLGLAVLAATPLLPTPGSRRTGAGLPTPGPRRTGAGLPAPGSRRTGVGSAAPAFRPRLDLVGNALVVAGSALVIYPLIRWGGAAWFLMAGVSPCLRCSGGASAGGTAA